MKVTHHGSKYSTIIEFLKLVKPEFSIISCRKENSYGHPHEELIRRLEEIDREYLITTEGGAVTVITDGKNMMIRQFGE